MSDLIDREELRKAMYHEAFEKDSDEQRWDSGCWIRYKMFERLVDSAPTIEPKRKQGKWIDETYYDSAGNEYYIWVCSRCKVLNSENTPYCPHCGARMEEE